jgi:ferredoxin
MTHVIAEPCIGTKDTACVEVCPVDCIHPTSDEAEFEEAKMLYIDPETCIDCGLCVDECPVQAIFTEEDLPEEWTEYLQVNADWYASKS